MKRSAVTIGAVAAVAVALIGVLAAANSSAVPQHRSRTVTFTLARAAGGFFPHGKPKPGTRYGSVQTVRGDDGSKGSAEVLCTFITAQARFCDVQFTLSTGTLAFQGIAYEPNINEPFTVTGGTATYAAGRGSATVNDVNKSTVRFTVKLPA
jgi:hypothetical protein